MEFAADKWPKVRRSPHLLARRGSHLHGGATIAVFRFMDGSLQAHPSNGEALMRGTATSVLCALAVAGVTAVSGAPAQAAPVRGVLLATQSTATVRIDPATGQELGTVGAGAGAAVSRSGRLAYSRDVDPCHPDVEGCFGAPDLLTARRDGSRERVIVHNPEAGGG
ncbi:hypothetical protein, partial [Micromonospora sp. WMMD812]|uniref:hypothetical protein n=1 Tax=Micromonospora sp. WMMD812 TaxID=3015152 RepID=UPI00248A9B80